MQVKAGRRVFGRWCLVVLRLTAGLIAVLIAFSVSRFDWSNLRPVLASQPAVAAQSVRVDVARVAAQIVTGVGFLGAGMIVLHKRFVVGLTTAAAIWTTAAIDDHLNDRHYIVPGLGDAGDRLFGTL